MQEGEKSLISIGSNLGNRFHNIQDSILELKNSSRIQFIKSSEIISTEPLEVLEQPEFLNSIAVIITNYSPYELLDFLEKIEIKLGRKIKRTKGPREIDLDILTFGNQRIQDERLTIPHPAISTRPFIAKLINSLGERIPL
jgi:2-amino-4-hydroxy-6-hydroxymethyldihydropteridine diphosphokinase